MTDFRAKALEVFEESGATGYGCCFEHESVKKECVSQIESALLSAYRKGWNEAVKKAASIIREREPAWGDFWETLRPALLKEIRAMRVEPKKAEVTR